MTIPDEPAVDEALSFGTNRLRSAGVDRPRLEAELLLADILNISRLDFPLKKKQVLSKENIKKYKASIQKRTDSIPLQYITEKVEFFGREFFVDDRVMIPRPETEVLVESIIESIRDGEINKPGSETVRICDLGTGSGVILITCCLELSKSEGIGVDISEAALEVARENAARFKIRDNVRWLTGDILETKFRSHLKTLEPFDIVVSNPPYIEEEELETLQSEVREHEPEVALKSPVDREHMYLYVARLAKQLLRKNGYFWMETSEFELNRVPELLEKAGLTNIQQRPDHRGVKRIVTAR